MQIVQSKFVNKPTVKITSAVRNASCSRGWLKFVVQYTFGAITVASFILILIMAMRGTVNNNVANNSRCHATMCRIVCHDAPYYAQYEDDVIFVSSNAEISCLGYSLILNNPIFINETMPSNWLSTIRVDVYNLIIQGGNLKYIKSDAFMSQFGASIVTILLDGVTITKWVPNTLVGLSSLQEIYIKNSSLMYISRNALHAVDDTLLTLTISISGSWNPVNVTGSGSTTLPKLELVDFSNNIFNNILTKESFTALVNCKILYLNSCKITAIGEGTFDYLMNIHIIYLNNNLLVTIPPGLFDNILDIVHSFPRINLQDNLWHCDCSMEDLRKLYRRDLLLINIDCYSPKEMHGQQLSALENYCTNNTIIGVVVVEEYEIETSTAHDKNNNYSEPHRSSNAIHDNYSWRLVSPIEQSSCKYNGTHNIDSFLRTVNLNRTYTTITVSDWIKPMFLLKSNNYVMMQVGLMESDQYGLLWFESECPYEIYCINAMPNTIRIYNINATIQYTFCPIQSSSGEIMKTKCVDYSFAGILNHDTDQWRGSSLILYITIGLISLTFGALFVYGMIRINPTLLKGSKRVLFVKHKNVDALILPPKVPLRGDSMIRKDTPHFNINNIYVVSGNQISAPNFVRMKSTRSNHSNTPSYISALQPTDDQLAEWRIQHHFDYSSALSSINSELSRFSSIPDDIVDDKSSRYSSIQDEKVYDKAVDFTRNITYESLK
ncbi:uncharacterized protein ACR2FA_002850 [Aphomia sociella]